MKEFTESVQARLTLAQKDMVRRAAEALGLTVSSFVRMAVLEKARKGGNE